MNSILKCCTILLLISYGLFLYSCNQDSGQNHLSEESIGVTETDEIPLIYHMSFISRYTKKLFFAGKAENWELADIYSHEIEEISEDIVARGERHDGVDISQLVDTMLLPRVEEVEDAIDSGDRDMFLERYNVMIQTCNQCHTASDYGAVQVTVPETNPFNQDFSTD